MVFVVGEDTKQRFAKSVSDISIVHITCCLCYFILYSCWSKKCGALVQLVLQNNCPVSSIISLLLLLYGGHYHWL